jgi:hypothetical protein
MKSDGVWSWRRLGVVVCVVVAAAGQAKAVATYGELKVTTTWEVPSTDQRHYGSAPFTTLSDTMQIGGVYGQSSDASYHFDLAAGTMGNYVHVHNAPVIGVAAHANGTAYSQISFTEWLDITIPAGTYAGDVNVVLNGSLEGSVSMTGTWSYPTKYPANQNQSVSIGNTALGRAQAYPYPYGPGWLAATELPYVLNDNFSLVLTMLPGGSTLTEPLTQTITVAANLSTTVQNYGNEYQSITGQFGNTLRLTSFIVPDGVTWTSESGVFLASVPEPATMGVLVIGIVVGLHRRNRRG